MGKTFIPYLCGGTFFRLLRNAEKPTMSRRERVKGKSNVIHDKDVLMALLRMVHPSVEEGEGNSFKTYTSRFRKCHGNIGQELRFEDEGIKENFEWRMKKEYPALRKAAVGFCHKYIDTEKHVQLAKQVIELIRDDESISGDTCFQVDDNGKEVRKSELPEVTDIGLPDFLLSVWFFIVTEHNDNESGRATIEKWDSRDKEEAFHITGKSIRHSINVWCVHDDAAGESRAEIAVAANREGAANLKAGGITERDDTANREGIINQKANVAAEKDDTTNRLGIPDSKPNAIPEKADRSVPGLFVLNESALKSYEKRIDSPTIVTYRRISAKMEHILYAVCSGATVECVLENREATLVDFIHQEIMKERQAVFLLGNGGIGKTTALVQTAVRICHTGKEVYLFQLGGEKDSQIMDEMIRRVTRSVELGEDRKYVLFIDSPCNNTDVFKALLDEVQYNENVQVVISEKLNRFDLVMEDVMPELYFNTAEIILPVLNNHNINISKIDGNRILKFQISPEWKRQIVLNMFRSIQGVDISKIESLVQIEKKMSIVEAYLRTCIQYNKQVDEGNTIAAACKVKLDWDEWDALVDQFASQLAFYEEKQLRTLFSIVAALDIFKVKARIGLLAGKMRMERTRLDRILRSMLGSGSNEPMIYENEGEGPYVKLKHDVVSELYFEVKKLNPQLVLEEIITVFDKETIIDFEKRVFKRKYIQSGYLVPFQINTKKLYELFQAQSVYYNILVDAHRSYSFDIAGIWMQETSDKQAVTAKWDRLLTDYLSRSEKPAVKRKVIACCRDDCVRRSLPFPQILLEQEAMYENALWAAIDRQDVPAIAEAWGKELLRIYQTAPDRKQLIYEWRKVIFDYLIYGFDMPDEFVEILNYEDYRVIDADYFRIRIYVKRNKLSDNRYYKLGIVLYRAIADRQREDVQSRMHLAYCHAQCNELAQAEAVYEELMKKHADLRQYSALGSLCARRLKDEWKLLKENEEEQKRLEETCERCFRCATEKAESGRDKGVSYGALGWFLFRTKVQFEESYRAFQKALEYDEQASTHGELGMLCCFFNKNNPHFSIEEAADHFERAIFLSPTSGLERLSLYMPYANMRYCIGEYDKAVDLYLKAAKLGEQKADVMLERIRRERKALDMLRERPLHSIMTVREAYELTYADKSIFEEEEKRNDIFTLLLNFASNAEKTPDDVRLAVFITLNLSRSKYRSARDLVKHRIIQQVELLAMEYDINREMAEQNFRAQSFFIAKSIKHYFSYDFKLTDYEMV